jgi:hypothetical protein
VSDDFLKTFLGGGDEAEAITLPTGEGLSRGFIGPVTAAVKQQFWSADEIDLESWFERDSSYKGFSERGREGSHFYYFDERDEARAAAEFVGAYAPRQVWRFEIPSAQVLNAATDLEESWGATIGGDVRITTLNSKKYRHEFHMMALPAAVNALGMRVGVLKEPAFSLEEVEANQLWTDAIQELLIGSSAAKEDAAAAFDAALSLVREAGIKGPESFVRQYILGQSAPTRVSRTCAYCSNVHPGDVAKCVQCGASLGTQEYDLEKVDNLDHLHFRNSLLWSRRAALWFGLGENNAAAYNPLGTGSKWDTTSEMLSKLLGIVTRPWVRPVWGRLNLVPDPRVDATYGDDDKRLSIACLMEIFPGEKEARAAAEAEGAVAETSKPKKSDGPALPGEWDGFETEWLEELRGIKEGAKDGKLPTLPKLKAAAESLSCTVDDIKAWWDQV